ncbi:MAG: glycosyltransferase [Solirubrobacteraceae bacterium]
MSTRPLKVCVALGDGAEPDPAWTASLTARAGVPADVIDAAGLAAALSGPAADVVVVSERIDVPENWLAALSARPAGLAVGVVTAVPVAAPAARLAAVDPALGQAVVADAPAAGCVLLTAEALQLVDTAGLDPRDPAGFARGFAARCAEHGLTNLVGDGAAVGVDLVSDADGPAGHARDLARARALGPRVTIDARSLVAGGAGTQVHTLELVRALAGREGLRLRIVLPPLEDVAPGALEELRALDGIELKSYADVVDSGIVDDVVHRPFQVFTIHDLRLLQRLGRRIIVTQQDQLLYRTPSYFASPADWEDYRQVCRIALAWADRTVFFTEHARREALRDELLEPAQASVVPIGVDRADPPAGEARRPDGVSDEPFLLMLGTDLAHKNRPFAVALWQALRAAGWDGGLVLAGPRAEHGGSPAVAAQPGLTTLGRVSERERAWLLEHCAAVVFASVEEGFGLMPFEAAEAGVPCLFAPVGAMGESLPAEAATIAPWDAEASARRAVSLLARGPARDEHVALLRAAAARYRWADVAERMEALYDEVLAAPGRHVAPVVAAEIEHQRRYEEFRARTGDDAMALLGPDGFLPPEMLRPLLAVSSRPALRRPLFALLRLLYRAGHRSG